MSAKSTIRGRAIVGERGFTLVEIVVVVVLLGILVTIVVAAYGSSRSRAYEMADRSNLRILRGAVVRYQADSTESAVYPATLEDLYPEYIQVQRPFREPGTNLPYAYDPMTGEVTNPRHPER